MNPRLAAIATLASSGLCSACAGTEPPRRIDTATPSPAASRHDVQEQARMVEALPLRVRFRAPTVQPLSFPPSTCSSNSGCWSHWAASDVALGGAMAAPRAQALTFRTTTCSSQVAASGYIGQVSNRFVDVLSKELDNDATWIHRRLELNGGSRDYVIRRDVIDVAGFADDLFVGSSEGAVITSPNGQDLALRHFWGSIRQDYGQPPKTGAFGAVDEVYLLNSPSVPGSLRRLGDRERTPAGTKASATLRRLWVNERWVLRKVDVSPTSFWEAASRTGSGARIVAYGGVGGCGNPLSGDVALALDEDDHGYSVIAISLSDGALAWKLTSIPLDRPHCVAAGDGIVAVGGSDDGYEAIAIHDQNRWEVVRLAGKRSIVEPTILGRTVVASAPDEDSPPADSSGGSVIRSAGAVYVLRALTGKWDVTQRIVASRPREMGLFGFRVGTARNRVIINHYVGPRAPDAEYGVTDGSPELCESLL